MTDLPRTMKAVRYHGGGLAGIHVDEVPVPEPNDNQLLARVDAAGVCTSNLKLLAQGSEHSLMNGWDPSKNPITLGDEGCVTIVKAGKNVAEQYPVGTRYATQPAVDVPPVNNLENYKNNGKGMTKVAVGYTLPGHMQEYMLIPEEVIQGECLLPLPSDDIPAFAGALCEPLSCCISAHTRHVHIEQASPAAERVPILGLLKGGIAMVIGAGPMGRLHAEAALGYSLKHLIVVDVVDARLQWVSQFIAPKAEKMGTSVHTVKSPDAKALLDQLSNGRGADDIIVAVGIKPVQVETQQWLAKGGVLDLFAGLKRGDHVIDLDTLRVHYDDIKVVGSSGGSPVDVARALKMVQDGIIDPGVHLDSVGSLDQFKRGLEMIQNTETDGKIVLYPMIPQTDLVPAQGWTRQDELTFLKEKMG